MARFAFPVRMTPDGTALRFREAGYAPSVAAVNVPGGVAVVTRGRGRLARAAKIAAGLAEVPLIDEPEFAFTSYHPAFDGIGAYELEEYEALSAAELAGLFDWLKKAGSAVKGVVSRVAPGARVEARVGPIQVDLTDPEERRQALEALQTAARATEITITRPAEEEATEAIQRSLLDRFGALSPMAKIALGVGAFLLLRKVA
jgi:hypothetical protein